MDGNNNTSIATDSSTVVGNGQKRKNTRISLKVQSRQVRTDRCNLA